MFLASPALIEKTRQLCADDPPSAKIRDQLLAIELDVHRQGWDSLDALPALFQVDIHPETSATDWNLSAIYTTTLRAALDRFADNIALGMGFMARHAEDVASLVRTGVPPKHWAKNVPEEVAADLTKDCLEAHELIHNAGVTGQNLAESHKEGYEFLGYGLRAELWSAYIDRTEQGQEALRYLNALRLAEYPAREEFRYVWFITRTGQTWIVERRRSHLPKVVVVRPGDLAPEDLFVGGPLLNGLSRMVNAVLADTVPIWPVNGRTEPPAASQPNPLIRPTS